jgi:hypothetical protein
MARGALELFVLGIERESSVPLVIELHGAEAGCVLVAALAVSRRADPELPGMHIRVAVRARSGRRARSIQLAADRPLVAIAASRLRVLARERIPGPAAVIFGLPRDFLE